MLNSNKLGKRIKQARKEKHMTAETFAEKVGISISFLREIERGNKKPSISNFVEIANALEVSADELLKDNIHASEPLILQGIAAELEDLTPKQINLIEKVVKAMKSAFQDED